jgi:hypothetical protein
MSEPLSLWNAGPTRDAVLAFVARVTDPQTGLPPEERVAVFDNDGTLWCEKPIGYLECAYAPMVQLLGYLEANGFTTLIVSGGGRDFMRPVTAEVYGVPSERVIGSASALAYVPDENGGTIVRRAAAEYVDDGPEKPVRIWNRLGRRPVLAGGNSNGDIEMLDWTRHPALPTLRLLVLHDDAEREFDYVAGSERALERAAAHGWTVVSVRDDWTSVF